MSVLDRVASLQGHSSPKTQSEKLITPRQANEPSSRTINLEEKEMFVVHINEVLKNDIDLDNRLPINSRTMDLFNECRDGLLLLKLINVSSPGAIKTNLVHYGKTKPLSKFQMMENNNLVIEGAKRIGCSVVNIGSSDLMEGRAHLILGLIWQIIKVGLMKSDPSLKTKTKEELQSVLAARTREQWAKLYYGL
jgi:plastin-1